MGLFFSSSFLQGLFHFGFRYEVFWLPLIAEFPDATVAAPLDIAWVWHVHMLSPLAYERDCNEIVSTLVDHKILVGEEREAGLQKAKLLWHQLYGSEPFEVDLTAPIGNEMPRVSRIQYDIVAACSRQRVFNYQVFLPHYGDETFLRDALERYKQHLRFKQQHPNTFLVPCYDFDLIWHVHQVHPLAYRTDTMKILGRVLNHDDSVNDRRPGSKLVNSAKATIKIWKDFGLDFEKNGAMFRGEPPLNIAENPNPIDYSSMAQRFKCLVDVKEVEIQGLPKPKLYLVKISFRSSLGVGGRQIRQETKGPAASFHESSGRPLTTFEFNNTRKSNFILVNSFFSHLKDL